MAAAACTFAITAMAVTAPYTDKTMYTFQVKSGKTASCKGVAFSAFLNSPFASTSQEFFCGSYTFGKVYDGAPVTVTCTTNEKGKMVGGEWNAVIYPSAGQGYSSDFKVTHSGTPPPGYVAQQRRRRAMECPSGMTACPVGGSSKLMIAGWECVNDVSSNLEQCGSCGGPDCTLLWDGLTDVACINGLCVDSRTGLTLQSHK